MSIEETTTVKNNAGESVTKQNVSVKKKKGNAVASLVMGICSLVFCAIGGIFGIIGLILGIIGVKKKQPKGLAVTGIVFSSIGIVLGLIALIGSIVVSILFGGSIIGLIKFAKSPAGQGIGTIISSVDFDDIDPDNPEESIERQLVAATAQVIVDSLNDKLTSEEGITITDSDGNVYTIQGDSIEEATIVDETTGEKIEIGEYVEAFQNGKDEFMSSLEDEYGITEDDMTLVMSEIVEQAGVDLDPESMAMLLEMIEYQ